MKTDTSESIVHRSVNKRNLLFWYGITISDIGIILWIISLNSALLIQLIDILTTHDITQIRVVGTQIIQWSFSVTSAAMIGWGLAIAALSRDFTEEKRFLFLSGLTLWFVLDSFTSILFGIYFNTVLNLGFYLPGIVLAYRTSVKSNE